MDQIKFFGFNAQAGEILEQNVNKWLFDNKATIKVIRITFSGHTGAFIHYRPEKIAVSSGGNL